MTLLPVVEVNEHVRQLHFKLVGLVVLLLLLLLRLAPSLTTVLEVALALRLVAGPLLAVLRLLEGGVLIRTVRLFVLALLVVILPLLFVVLFIFFFFLLLLPLPLFLVEWFLFVLLLVLW